MNSRKVWGPEFAAYSCDSVCVVNITGMAHMETAAEAVASHRQDGAPTQKLAYQIDEAARACGIGRTSLYELIGEGKLKAIRAAGRRLILREDLEAYLRSCREAA